MNKSIAVTAEFNREKNIRAGIYTAVIAIAILLLVWIVKFYEPVVPLPPPEEFIEINLGSSDVGSGNSQPEIPGEPAPQQQTSYTPPQPTTSATQESAKDVEESNINDDPPVKKPTNTKPDAKNYEETKTVKVTKPSVNTTPAPPQPRAVMGQVRGGNGTGGNGATTYKPGTGEGPGDGPGDKGSIGGNPNGKRYNGGPRVVTGDRQIVRSQELKGDLGSAIIFAEILVSPEGRGTFNRITRGIQTMDYKNEIRRHLERISFNKSDHESKVVVEFTFVQGG